MGLRTLFNKFPREIGTPSRRFVSTETELYSLIDRHNARVGCHVSLYDLPKDMTLEEYLQYKKLNKMWYLNCHLDKIWFDFDGEKAITYTRKLHELLIETNIKHLLVFSGNKGFHVYILTTNYEKLKNPKGTLRLLHEHFESLLSIEVDEKVKGDVARMARVPNTKHIDGNRYCIPITTSMLANGWDFIKERAKEQNFELKFYGDNYFDVGEFDCEPTEYENGETCDITENNIEVDLTTLQMDNILAKFPPCVLMWLEKPKQAKITQRHWYALYCSIIQIPIKIADHIAIKSWNTTMDSTGRVTKYQEFDKEKQLKCAYTQIGKYYFPTCDTLKKMGYCKEPENCKFRDKIYYTNKK